MFAKLEAHGFDQIPTGSNWRFDQNFGGIVRHCRNCVAPNRLQGFLQTTWPPTLEPFRQRHREAIDQVAAAMKASA
jgi:hypothetical protein